MRQLKLKKINNNVEHHSTGAYVEAQLFGAGEVKAKYYQITDNSYYRYLELRKSGKTKDVSVFKMLTTDNQKIALFHNGPYKTRIKNEEDYSVLSRADILVCCYSVFLERELLNKCAVKSLFQTSSTVEEIDGKKYLIVFQNEKGLLPLSMFEDGDVLENEAILDEIIKIKEARYS